MRFRAATSLGIIDASNTVELWDGPRLAATVHATLSGIHIECERGYEPDAHGLAVQVQRPYGVTVALCRDDV
jgi:hypothetical protein